MSLSSQLSFLNKYPYVDGLNIEQNFLVKKKSNDHFVIAEITSNEKVLPLLQQHRFYRTEYLEITLGFSSGLNESTNQVKALNQGSKLCC
ncbi:hypothetical protein [Acinetobacter puyangensis]|uniref:hypothetical protein n=1 Tax=Acinetobacter puyangensis TaxID=1096779 RepID=UPI003A4DAD2D